MNKNYRNTHIVIAILIVALVAVGVSFSGELFQGKISRTSGTVSTASILYFNLNKTATPSTTLIAPKNNVALLSIDARSKNDFTNSPYDNTIKSLTLQGYISVNTVTNGGTYAKDGTAESATFGDAADSKLASTVTNFWLQDGLNQVSNTISVDSNGKLVFTNLNISIPKGTTKTLTLRGDLIGGPFGNYSDRIKFGILNTSDVVATDQNGQAVPIANENIIYAQNDREHNYDYNGIVMTISKTIPVTTNAP